MLTKKNALLAALTGWILFATVSITGCNNQPKDADTPSPTPGAETKPATSTQPPPTALDSVKTDTLHK